jgi:hypothetical protein
VKSEDGNEGENGGLGCKMEASSVRHFGDSQHARNAADVANVWLNDVESMSVEYSLPLSC